MKTVTAQLQCLLAASNAAALPILSALLCLLPQVGLCSQESILEPVEVSIRADAGAPFGEVVATICTSGRDSERRISDIQLRVGGKSIRIPARAYGDLASPLLNTVELRTEVGYNKEPWLYLVFQVGSRTSDGQWRPKRVHIPYHAGRIASRSIEPPNPDGGSTRKDDVVGKCFGIANTFSGKLSEEQERMVPEALRRAFTIESLRKITASDLAKELEFKAKVAEETHEGKRYVALKDFRHVVFSDDVSGMMIVIERYLVTWD